MIVTKAQVVERRIEQLQADAIRLTTERSWPLRELTEELLNEAWKMGSRHPMPEVSRALSTLLAHDRITMGVDQIVRRSA